MSSLLVPQPYNDAFDGNPNFDGVNTVLGIAPVAGVYTMTQNIGADTIYVRSGVRILTLGFVFWCRILYTEAGSYISFNGNNGAGTTGGALFTNQGHLGCAGGAGGAGATRTTIGSTAGSVGGGAGSGSVGGASGAGGAGGTGAGGAYNATTALVANQFRFWRSPQFASVAWKMPGTGNAVAFTNVNSGGGGGGGGVQITGQAGVLSLDGGGGGGAGGIVAFWAGVIDARGTIEALGGNGANAVINAGVTGGAGGGGGGSGGSIHGSFGRVARLGTFRIPGGTGGTGAGGATGFAGLNGSPGSLALFVNGEAI